MNLNYLVLNHKLLILKGNNNSLKYLHQNLHDNTHSEDKKYSLHYFFKNRISFQDRQRYYPKISVNTLAFTLIIQKPDSPLSAVPTRTPNPVSSRPPSSIKGGKRKTNKSRKVRKRKSRRNISKKYFFR